MTGRYRIRRIPFTVEEYDSVSRPYGIWDTMERCYVNKYGDPDADYWAANRAVAVMRRRDLNEYDRGRTTP